jgi:hypothetical protein
MIIPCSHRELILIDAIDIHATISFDSIKIFRDVIKNTSTASIKEAVSRGTVKVTGNGSCIDTLQRKISHNMSMVTSPGKGDAYEPKPVSASKFYRMSYNGELIQPLKHGWMQKKRDIL